MPVMIGGAIVVIEPSRVTIRLLAISGGSRCPSGNEP
jgi:hypothetical protein